MKKAEKKRKERGISEKTNASSSKYKLLNQSVRTSKVKSWRPFGAGLSYLMEQLQTYFQILLSLVLKPLTQEIQVAE